MIRGEIRRITGDVVRGKRPKTGIALATALAAVSATTFCISTALASTTGTSPTASKHAADTPHKHHNTTTKAPAAAAAPAPTPSATPTPATGTPTGTSLASALGVTPLSLSAPFQYQEPGYNNRAQWTRVAVAAAPGGTLQVAWPAADGVHVTPLSQTLARSGADSVVSGSKEVGGLVAHDDGFALLTRVPDNNKWGDTAAALVRYSNGHQVFADRLTGTATNDTSPVLDSKLAWNGTRYGAYFVVHGAGGPADGHYGDKLSYIGGNGAQLSGGWTWGCSHNEGIALHPEQTGDFTSLCFDDWRSGLFVSTGISAPDNAPVIQREQCWAGYCGGSFPGNAGDIVKSAAGQYAVAFGSRGSTSAGKNPQDSSGRGWTVTPRWDTHQVAVAFLKNGSTPSGSPVYLTSDPSTDNTNVHIAPYGKNRLLVSWESVANASCANGTCTGHFTGTHLRLIDYSGHSLSPDTVVNAHISGDIAALPNGDLAWAFVNATPDYSAPLGTPPTTSTLSLARLRLIGE
jgi:hypothetical protein